MAMPGLVMPDQEAAQRRKARRARKQALEVRERRTEHEQEEPLTERRRDLHSIVNAVRTTDLKEGGGYFRLPKRVRRFFNVP